MINVTILSIIKLMSQQELVKRAIDKAIGKLVRLKIKDGRTFLGKSLFASMGVLMRIRL